MCNLAGLYTMMLQSVKKIYLEMSLSGKICVILYPLLP